MSFLNVQKVGTIKPLKEVMKKTTKVNIKN